MIRVGIIGCGKIAQVRHIPEYLANPGSKIMGYYDVNQERADMLAKKFGGSVYNNYEDMLDDPEIDAVSICTANKAHGKIAVEALKKKKHVLCEKPMATTLEECQAMTAAAKKSKSILMIGHNQRLTSVHKRAKLLLEEGVIGRVITFRSTFGHSGPENWSIDKGRQTWFFDRQQAFMGAMADLGVHKTDLLQFLLNDKINAVTAYMGTLDKTDSQGNLISVDDNAVCILEMAGGSVGTMTASWTFYGEEDNSTVIYGTDGILKLYTDPDHGMLVIKKDGTKIIYEAEAMQTNENQTSSGVIDAFIESITGDTSMISGESVLSAMKAVFAAKESAEKGKRVEII
ncbi:MAG: Gfo/Idh/MocA family oxidoreductase [Eubacteriales bacterium]|nr:Gfo/Idh/MocA family oxidoreductase [Eubacteriales bacterium]